MPIYLTNHQYAICWLTQIWNVLVQNHMTEFPVPSYIIIHMQPRETCLEHIPALKLMVCMAGPVSMHQVLSLQQLWIRGPLTAPSPNKAKQHQFKGKIPGHNADSAEWRLTTRVTTAAQWWHNGNYINPYLSGVSTQRGTFFFFFLLEQGDCRMCPRFSLLWIGNGFVCISTLRRFKTAQQ